MNLATSILGTSAVAKLQEQHGAAVLQIGSDKLTRSDLARVSCFNFHAARMLTHVLSEFSVRSLKDLYDNVPPSALTVPQLGVVSLAVLGAAFEAKGIGGSTPLENYVKKHAETNGNGTLQITTFDTMKKHALSREAEASKNTRRRRRR
jgi:uncharacterized protein YbaP (TraB family)